MKKNISINIGSIIFHIEEDGYDKLKTYLDSVSKYFSSFDESKEIIEDIEGRIAEIFLAKLDDGKQVINQEDIDELIATMGTTKDFEATIENEPEEERSKTEDQTTDSEPSPASSDRPPKLYRNAKNKVLGGVASGIAHYFGIDPIWIRLLLLAFLFNIFFWGLSGFTLLAYIILWIVIPIHAELEDDKTVKKLFRNTDDRVLGGICSGIASYFGADAIVVRLLFVLSIFLGGAGLVVYIIMWIIIPEATTITEKMQMQGEPVTIANIEDNVKKSLNVKDGDENAVVKILLFPFRLIAMVIKALGEILGPILKFIVEALRVLAGIFFVVLGFLLMICFSISLAVILGVGGAMESWVQFGHYQAGHILMSAGTLAILSTYIVSMIPALGLSLLGLVIILKRRVIGIYVAWSLFGLWLIGMIGVASSVPSLIGKFRVENTYREERSYQVTDAKPTLKLNEDYLDWDFRYDNTALRLRGHADSTYLLLLEIDSRGANRADAKKNAKTIIYEVIRKGDDFIFDANIALGDSTPFRFQELHATFYIPYDKVFRMDDDLSEILINTLHLNGYRASQMKGNDWVFNEDGIQCLTCNPKGDADKIQISVQIQSR